MIAFPLNMKLCCIYVGLMTFFLLTANGCRNEEAESGEKRLGMQLAWKRNLKNASNESDFSIAISDDGKYIAISNSELNDISMFQLKTGDLAWKKRINGLELPGVNLFFSHDGLRLFLHATGSGFVQSVNVLDGGNEKSIRLPTDLYEARFANYPDADEKDPSPFFLQKSVGLNLVKADLESGKVESILSVEDHRRLKSDYCVTSDKFVVGCNGLLIAFDRRTLEKLWEKRVSRAPRISISKIEENQAIICVVGSPNLFCIDLQNGNTLKEVKIPFSSSFIHQNRNGEVFMLEDGIMGFPSVLRIFDWSANLLLEKQLSVSMGYGSESCKTTQNGKYLVFVDSVGRVSCYELTLAPMR